MLDFSCVCAGIYLVLQLLTFPIEHNYLYFFSLHLIFKTGPLL